jgi:uncharacterized protein YbjT (DUF2867 family)
MGAVELSWRSPGRAAATAVLTQDEHLGATYELGGTPFALTDLAATISDVLGPTSPTRAKVSAREDLPDTTAVNWSASFAYP